VANVYPFARLREGHLSAKIKYLGAGRGRYLGHLNISRSPRLTYPWCAHVPAQSLTEPVSLQQEVLNIVVGIVGATLGGWLLSKLVGVSTRTVNQSNLHIPGLLVLFLGVVI